MKYSLLIIVISFTFLGCEEKDPLDIQPETENEKVLYSMGRLFGERTAELKLSDKEILALLAGLKDAANSEESKVDYMLYKSKIKDFLKQKKSNLKKQNKTQAEIYAEEFLARGGARTKSGLYYRINKTGNGETPNSNSTVVIHYEGRVIAGPVFDSSRNLGKPLEISLNKAMKGWSEGLQLIKQGGEITLLIPPHLGYGNNGAPPNVPAGAYLEYDFYLYQVK